MQIGELYHALRGVSKLRAKLDFAVCSLGENPHPHLPAKRDPPGDFYKSTKNFLAFSGHFSRGARRWVWNC